MLRVEHAVGVRVGVQQRLHFGSGGGIFGGDGNKASRARRVRQVDELVEPRGDARPAFRVLRHASRPHRVRDRGTRARGANRA